MIDPHGGRLVNRLVSGEKAAVLEADARELPVIQLNPFEVSDLEMLAIGAFSPLEGFMGRADNARVIEDKRLANDLPWTLPGTLAATEEVAKMLKRASRAVLREGGQLPPEFTRPEVATVLRKAFGQRQIGQGD